VYWREDFHYWHKGGAHVLKKDKEVRGYVTASSKKEFDRLASIEHACWHKGDRYPNGQLIPEPVARKVTRAVTGDLLQALASVTQLPDDVTQPSWLPGCQYADTYPANDMLVCRNGMVHVPTVLEERGELLPLTPLLFTANALDYDFDFDAPAPARWLQFMEEIWPDDEVSIRTLQEWFGYCLLPDTSQQKILLMEGPPRSGRGTIARVLTALIGPANICNPTLHSLGNEFGLQPLLGKTLAIVSDCGLSHHSNVSLIAENLKRISGEDDVDVNRKFRTALNRIKLPLRFMVLCNELPEIKDTSCALPHRHIILHFENSWEGKEDTTLTARLLSEIDGILLWALRGLDRLRMRGYFRQPKSGQEAAGTLEALSSGVKGFVEDCCLVGPQWSCPKDAVYKAWCEWCAEEGIAPTLKSVFCRDLRTVARKVREIKHGGKGKRLRYLEGIRLKNSKDNGG
jgi:putative DNA primase/helicase